MGIMQKKLKLVQAHDVERILRCQKNDQISDVFFARILIENQSEQVFLKLYPQKSGSRGLLNEVLGYLYGTVANVPQPKFAGIAIVPVELLKPYSKSLSNSLQSVIDNETHLPAFFTKSIAGTQYLYDYLNPWLKQQILRWKAFQKSVVFDEIIANTDRYSRNLIHDGNNQFYLIDNGFLATEDNTNPNWKASLLDPKKSFENQLANVNYNDVVADRRKGSEFILEAETYFLSFHHLLPEMEYWITNFANEDKDDWQKFLELLQYRTDNIHKLLCQRYDLVI